MQDSPIGISAFHLKLIQANAAHHMMLNASDSWEETFFRNRWKALEQELDEIASEILEDKP
jgi:hypothetical protein